MPIVYIPPTNGPFFKVENPIFESKRARKIWLPLLLILGAVTVGGMFIGHFLLLKQRTQGPCAPGVLFGEQKRSLAGSFLCFPMGESTL